MDKKIYDLCMKNILHFFGKSGKEYDDPLYNRLICSVEAILGDTGKLDVNGIPIWPLSSIFNLLNQNGTSLQYDPFPQDEIPYPKSSVIIDDIKWQEQKTIFLDSLAALPSNEAGLNHALDLSADLFSYSSYESKDKSNYVSLADYLQFSTCLCANIFQYFQENNPTNFAAELSDKLAWPKNKEQFLAQNIFLLCSCDFSGIQKFIYTISGKGALKSLRSRSFYLEMLLAHVLNSLLSELGLPGANCLYTGGGHAYLLLPNTPRTLRVLESGFHNVNDWLLQHFANSLYLAYGVTAYSAHDLGGSSDLFRRLAVNLSENKLNRYDLQQIKMLNTQNDISHSRECRICSGNIENKAQEQEDEELCSFCRDFINISAAISAEELLIGVFSAGFKDANLKKISIKEPEQIPLLRLPALDASTAYLCFLTPAVVRKLQSIPDRANGFQIYFRKKHDNYNKQTTGNKPISGSKAPDKYTPIIGREIAFCSYAYQLDNQTATFEQLADSSEGIERIAIMRADVDNLGTVFLQGFAQVSHSLMYTMALSKQLSYFFKEYLQYILKTANCGIEHFRLSPKPPQAKKVVVVYSGGDDMFIAGAWNDVIETAVDLQHSFAKFTANALTFSAGIGLFETKYPLYAMAQETQQLEDFAKSLDEKKNAVALFGTTITQNEDGNYHMAATHTYKWDEFIQNVIGEKFRQLQHYYANTAKFQSANGNTFLYRLKTYIEEIEKNPQERINIARFVYLLARLNQVSKNEQDQILYSDFSSRMVSWITNSKDRKELLTAITIYVYLIRDKKERKETSSG